MAYKTGQSFAASTNNHPKHHAILVVGTQNGSTAGVTLYSSPNSTVLPIQIKNTGVLDGITLYGLA